MEIKKTNDFNLDMGYIACTVVEMVTYHSITILTANRVQMLFDFLPKGSICLSNILGMAFFASYQVYKIIAATIDCNGRMVCSGCLMADYASGPIKGHTGHVSPWGQSFWGPMGLCVRSVRLRSFDGRFDRSVFKIRAPSIPFLTCLGTHL